VLAITALIAALALNADWYERMFVIVINAFKIRAQMYEEFRYKKAAHIDHIHCCIQGSAMFNVPSLLLLKIHASR
jgi:hypothetical protein